MDDLIQKLDAHRLPENAPPHYWPISWPVFQDANRPLVEAICKATGGIMATHTNSAAVPLAIDLFAETGCKIALWVGMRVYMRQLEDVLFHDPILHDRAAQFDNPLVDPELIVFHYESPPATKVFTLIYDHLMRRHFPNIPIAYYGYPGWGMGPFGTGNKATYEKVYPPADVLSADLYHEDVAANSHILKALRGLQAEKPILPVVSHGGTYRSYWRGTGNNNWAWTRQSRGSVAWWNLGFHLGVMNTRLPHGVKIGPYMAGIYLYKTFFERNTNLETLVDDWCYYVQGWREERLSA